MLNNGMAPLHIMDSTRILLDLIEEKEILKAIINQLLTCKSKLRPED